MIYKYFKIIDLIFQIGGTIPFDLVDTYKAFEIENIDDKEIDIIINVLNEKPINFNQYEFKNKIEDTINYAFFENDKEKLKVSYDSKKQLKWCVQQQMNTPNIYDIYIYEPWKGNLVCFDPLVVIGLPNFFLQHQAIILHSSLIKINNYAILFSAPSGTGKSTQADLWVKYHNAEILNGDRSIIKKVNNEYYAYGSMYAGSSYIYKSDGAKIKGIIVLKQAKFNKISILKTKEKFLSLISEALLCNDDKVIYERQMDYLLQLISNVPIYLLECLPDKDATDVVYNYLKVGK